MLQTEAQSAGAIPSTVLCQPLHTKLLSRQFKGRSNLCKDLIKATLSTSRDLNLSPYKDIVL